MSLRRLLSAYACLVGMPLCALVGILRLGQGLASPAAAAGPSPASGAGDVAATAASAAAAASAAPDVAMLVAQLAVILGMSRVVGMFAQRLGQPVVIGEMFAGIMLGPSLLGRVAPHVSAWLFPPATVGYLGALSQLGAVVYMFIIGVSLDPRSLRDQRHAAVLVSHASIVVPFVLGAALALVLYPSLAGGGFGFDGFALFMGASMSVTAFPVLARILVERRLLGTRLGSLAIACAAVDDVTGWCILAYVILLVRAQGATAMPFYVTVLGLAVFVALMWGVARRLLRPLETAYRARGLGDDALALMLVVALVSALAAEQLGVHLLFGAFLAGAVMPKDREFARHVADRLETAVVVLLLPLYFGFTGLRTRIDLIDTPALWAVCAAITAVAVLGKLGGSFVAARALGSPWREAAGLGILMNTRGLMELLILNVGLDIGVISPALFSMMVLMALVTTFMTAPLLDRVCPAARGPRERRIWSEVTVVQGGAQT